MSVLFNPVTLLLATLCMQWVALGSIGSFSVKLPYVALLLVILYALTGPKKLANAVLFAQRNAYWILPITLYSILIGLIQVGTPAANSAPRQIFYLIGSIALAGSLATTPRLARTFRYGAVLGFVMLIVSVEMLARNIGLSWTRALAEFFDGNLKFIVYSFFRDVFNAVDPTGDPLGAAIKNEVAVGVLILGLLFRSASLKPGRDIAGMACTLFMLLLLLLLNTRSVLIAAAISIVLAFGIGAARKPHRNVPELLFKGIVTVGIMAAFIASSFQVDALSASLGQRFAFDDYSTSARLEQFAFAMQRIELHPLVGNGYVELNGHYIHNLFLSAWVQGGLAAFLLTVIFYGGLLFAWLHFIWRIVKRPGAWVLPIAPEWLAPLPITPLFRVWSSGDGGNMYLGEWVAVACFFGCCLANELQRRAIGRRRMVAAAQDRAGPDWAAGWRGAMPDMVARDARLR